MKKEFLQALLVATFLVKVVLAIPFVSGIECDQFSRQKLEDCKYILKSDFSDIEKEELLNILDEQSYDNEIIQQKSNEHIGLVIRTDKQTYKIDETIEVDIFPKNILVSVTYGDITKFAKDKTSFKAKADTNRIIVEYQNERYERIFTLINQDKIILAWKIILLFLINYSVFSFLTKSSEVSKWLNVDY